MNKPLTEVRFWAQVLADAERTICCSPDNESRIKGWIDARGLSGLYKVIASPFVPDGQVFVVDEHAVDAATREAAHKDHRAAMRRLTFETAWQARHRLAGKLVDPRAAFRITGL